MFLLGLGDYSGTTKKGLGHLFKNPQVTELYRFIEEHRSTFGVERMCRCLEVSRSGYYDWKGKEPSRRERANEALTTHIKAIHEQSERLYGSPRITSELRDRGFHSNAKRVARLMREAGIRAKTVRRFKVTTRSDQNLPVAPNLVNRRFVADTVNQLWTSDITYIWTREGWMYLAVILDVYSRQIVGWNADRRLKQDLVVNALNQALHTRAVTPGLIFHSDQGSQYAAHTVRGILRACHIRQSTSNKGDFYDNAITESFFSTLKRALVYPNRSFQTRAEAKSALFYYIEYVYNRIRKHSFLGYQSPVQYETLKNVAELPVHEKGGSTPLS